ncbi:prepilin peptidase [Paucilactobacillus wasatchensis]|uniref:Late competence protein ComC, processing protease n=1 Tax=Paucilactobacillus wasatchensis TaxID=1335616 RepID=A0A0D0Y4E4_9LACO|nr:A24 family peptidase [Paucilactobacillus wasatchensis]KIS03133.1 Late competence protein ComC, processing protease [Paucilactobacillus wasatchensis]
MLTIFYFIYGACFASFLSLTAVRLVNHQSIIAPRSHCDQCNHQLKNWQLIPIIGFLVQGGRCHFCHAKISSFSTIAEIGLGIFFTTLQQYSVVQSLTWICASATLIFCAATDVTSHFIYSPCLLGFIPSLALTVHWQQFSISAGLSLGLTILILAITSLLTHGLGLGDIELIIIFQLLLGFTPTMIVLAVSSFASIIYFIITKHKSELAFVPFLAFSFLLVVSWPSLIELAQF